MKTWQEQSVNTAFKKLKWHNASQWSTIGILYQRKPMNIIVKREKGLKVVPFFMSLHDALKGCTPTSRTMYKHRYFYIFEDGKLIHLKEEFALLPLLTHIGNQDEI